MTPRPSVASAPTIAPVMMALPRARMNNDRQLETERGQPIEQRFPDRVVADANDGRIRFRALVRERTTVSTCSNN